MTGTVIAAGLIYLYLPITQVSTILLYFIFVMISYSPIFSYAFRQAHQLLFFKVMLLIYFIFQTFVGVFLILFIQLRFTKSIMEALDFFVHFLYRFKLIYNQIYLLIQLQKIRLKIYVFFFFGRIRCCL